MDKILPDKQCICLFIYFFAVYLMMLSAAQTLAYSIEMGTVRADFLMAYFLYKPSKSDT
jgi:hypothetical protein